MRVPVMMPGRRRRDERGATAVLAASLAVVLIGLSAFTVDFGRAYNSKRQLQSGADAGSLAAAAHYATQRGTCSDMTSGAVGTTNYDAARLKAAAILQETRPGATIVDLTVTCTPPPATVVEVHVDMTVAGATPVALGGVYGVNSVTTQRAAQATVEVADTVDKGLRPYMLCTKDLPGPPFPSGVVKISFAGQAGASSECPTAQNPGNWWTVNCPEDNSNSNAVLEHNTRYGCDDPVSIVAGQPADLAQPALTNSLLAGCQGGADQDCLNAVTGNINGAGIWDAWNSLLGKSVVVPIFCGDPRCTPAAISGGPGNNTNYPVHRFGAVTVCGYHWGANPQTQGISTTGSCAGNPHNVTDGGNNDNYVLFKFADILVTGSTKKGTCSLGDPKCDLGVRKIRLTK